MARSCSARGWTKFISSQRHRQSDREQEQQHPVGEAVESTLASDASRAGVVQSRALNGAASVRTRASRGGAALPRRHLPYFMRALTGP